MEIKRSWTMKDGGLKIRIDTNLENEVAATVVDILDKGIGRGSAMEHFYDILDEPEVSFTAHRKGDDIFDIFLGVRTAVRGLRFKIKSLFMAELKKEAKWLDSEIRQGKYMGGAVLFDPKMRIFAYRGTLPDGRFEKLPEGMVAVDRMPFNQHQFKPDEKWPKPCFVCTGRGFIPDFKEGLSPNPVVKICDCVLPRKGLGR